MKGHLRKRGERSWAIVIELDRDPVTGKRRQKWHTVQGTKKKAEGELARLLNDVATGGYVEPAKMTVAEYLRKWLEDYAKPKVSAKTYERYAQIVNNGLTPILGPVILPKLSPLQIQSCYSAALASGRKDGREGGLSAQTVLHHHRVLHEALRQAVKWQLLARNPADAVEPPRPRRMEMRALTETETVWLLDAAEGTRLYLPILLAVTTGMHRGEILALRWKDVDLAGNRLSISQSLEETRGVLRFKQPKTAKGRRMITLPPITTEALVAHHAAQAKERGLLGEGYKLFDLVLAREDGSIWKPESFTALYFNFVRRIGLKVRFHDLRHTHASQLLRAGISPKVVSERLGHSTIGITLDVYSHVLPGMQEEAATRVETALRKAMEQRPTKLA